jgi:uncharacterized protein
MFSRIFLFLFLIQFFAFAQDIPQRPNPPTFVNDFVGGLLSKGEINQLEQKLKAYNDSTSTQVVIVIVKSVQPNDISEYAIKLGREWGIGQKDKNNGIVFLWAPSDRKVFIATGYGAEGALTDANSKRIIETVVVPNFKQLNYYKGLDEATNSIFKYLSGEFDAESDESTFNGKSWSESSWIEKIGWILFVTFIIGGFSFMFLYPTFLILRFIWKGLVSIIRYYRMSEEERKEFNQKRIEAYEQERKERLTRSETITGGSVYSTNSDWGSSSSSSSSSSGGGGGSFGGGGAGGGY